MDKKKSGENKFFKIIFGRSAVITILVLLQAAVLLGTFVWLRDYSIYIYAFFVILTGILVVHIINDKSNPLYKLSWMLLVTTVPVFGGLFYLFLTQQKGIRKMAGAISKQTKNTEPFLKQGADVMRCLHEEDERMAHLSQYVQKYGGYPIYQNTSVMYFPLGEDKFEEMKKQMRQAEKFIFMEYFIVDEGIMWDELLAILEEKAKKGVEIRFMYDGMCSLVLLPFHYPDKLREKGIQCKMFNPVIPMLSSAQNNRDHRKILVIDGHTAFTGGVNLADEYINEKEVYGHWKDTAVMLKGEAVQSFTMMFLQMWNMRKAEGEEDYTKYIYPNKIAVNKELGYVMPYADSPMDDESVGELVYMNIINCAVKYVHIMTPYLILDNEMITSLCYTAKSGTEVIIIVPHIPDKIYAYLLARTYYSQLIQAGVRIFEYTPGFIHAKCFISDDENAVVGTINMDFRSLYLHFECAAYMFKNPVIKAVEQDFQNTLKKCMEITLEDCINYSVWRQLMGKVLRIFAPLM